MKQVRKLAGVMRRTLSHHIMAVYLVSRSRITAVICGHDWQDCHCFLFTHCVGYSMPGSGSHCQPISSGLHVRCRSRRSYFSNTTASVGALRRLSFPKPSMSFPDMIEGEYGFLCTILRSSTYASCRLSSHVLGFNSSTIGILKA